MLSDQGLLRVQQQAARVSFFMPGLISAAWAPLVPFAQSRAKLDEAGLGILLLFVGVGALLAMPSAGILVSRYGCRKILIGGALIMCLTFILLTWVSSPWWLAVILFGMGAGVGAMDCAINIQGVAIESDSNKPMMSGFHAFFSIGSVVGVASMTGLLSLSLSPLVASFLLVSVLLGLLLWASPYWRSDRVAQDIPSFALPKGNLLLIGVLCFAMFLVEGAMMDWSAIFLSDIRGMDKANAGVGFLVFSLTMTAMRLCGDAVIPLLGRHRIIVFGSLLAFIGLILAAIVPFVLVVLAGYAVAGIGCANVVPALFSLAGQQKVMPTNLAIPAVTTLGYLGVLAGPALVGFMAHATSLAVSFTGLGVLMIGVTIAMRFLKI